MSCFYHISAIEDLFTEKTPGRSEFCDCCGSWVSLMKRLKRLQASGGRLRWPHSAQHEKPLGEVCVQNHLQASEIIFGGCDHGSAARSFRSIGVPRQHPAM